MLDKMLQMIPDAFAKSKESNLGKIFILLNDELGKLNGTAKKVEAWRDIDSAEGKTLELIGNDYEQHRGQDGDSLYRFMIKSKIEQSQSNGTFNELINVICRTINCLPEDVDIVSGRLFDNAGGYVGEPLAIEVKSVPMSFFRNTDIKVSSFVESLQSSVATGVRIVSIAIEAVTTLEINHKRTVYKFRYDLAGDGLRAGETPYESTLGMVSFHDFETAYKNEGFVVQTPLMGEEPSVNRLADINSGFVTPGVSTNAYSYEVSFSGEDDF